MCVVSNVTLFPEHEFGHSVSLVKIRHRLLLCVRISDDGYDVFISRKSFTQQVRCFTMANRSNTSTAAAAVPNVSEPRRVYLTDHDREEQALEVQAMGSGRYEQLPQTEGPPHGDNPDISGSQTTLDDGSANQQEKRQGSKKEIVAQNPVYLQLKRQSTNCVRLG